MGLVHAMRSNGPLPQVYIQTFSQLLLQVRHQLKVMLLSPISAMMVEQEPGHAQNVA